MRRGDVAGVKSWFWSTLKGPLQMTARNAVCQHLFTSTKHLIHLFYPEMTDAFMCDCNSDTRLRSTRPAEV